MLVEASSIVSCVGGNSKTAVAAAADVVACVIIASAVSVPTKNVSIMTSQVPGDWCKNVA